MLLHFFEEVGSGHAGDHLLEYHGRVRVKPRPARRELDVVELLHVRPSQLRYRHAGLTHDVVRVRVAQGRNLFAQRDQHVSRFLHVRGILDQGVWNLEQSPTLSLSQGSTQFLQFLRTDSAAAKRLEERVYALAGPAESKE